MNLVHIAEAGLGLIVAYEGVVRGGPALWRFATKKTPKLADEARLIFSDVETAAERVVSEVMPAVHTAEAEAAPVVQEAVAEAGPVVTELEEAAAGLVDQVKGYLAAKDAEIADLAAKTEAATAQRTGLAGELGRILA